MKFLLFIGFLGAVYYVFFKKKSLNPPSSNTSTEEAMIPCTKCGTYAQMKETFTRDGKYYCSRECLEA
jgi:uncharacterized protein